MQIFSSRKRELEASALLLTVAAIGVTGYGAVSASITMEPQRIAALLGPYGPAGIVGTQFAQVLVAPMPPVTPVVSGMLYGVTAGTFYSVVGAAAGSLVAILMARRYGRSAVQRFLSEKAMEKFDRYTSGHGYLPFVVLFVFPGFPDDALCFIAGLTKLDWKKLFIVASLGRIPGIALLAMTGSSAAQANTSAFLLSGAAVVMISYGSIKYEQELKKLVARIEKDGLSIFSPVWSRL